MDKADRLPLVHARRDLEAALVQSDMWLTRAALVQDRIAVSTQALAEHLTHVNLGIRDRVTKVLAVPLVDWGTDDVVFVAELVDVDIAASEFTVHNITGQTLDGFRADDIKAALCLHHDKYIEALRLCEAARYISIHGSLPSYDDHDSLLFNVAILADWLKSKDRPDIADAVSCHRVSALMFAEIGPEMAGQLWAISPKEILMLKRQFRDFLGLKQSLASLSSATHASQHASMSLPLPDDPPAPAPALHDLTAPAYVQAGVERHDNVTIDYDDQTTVTLFPMGFE